MTRQLSVALLVVVCTFLILSGGCTPGTTNGTPSIQITSVPPLGGFGNATGIVRGVSPNNYKVSVWICVSGGWWPKPTFAEPLTPIGPLGMWSAKITTGGIDETATEIRAYLVPSDFEFTDSLDDMSQFPYDSVER